MSFQDAKSIPNLFGDVAHQLGNLIGAEMRLAKAEASQKLGEAKTGIVYIALAAIVAIPALVMILLAVALWLNEAGLSLAVSHLIAGGIGAALCLILALVGVNRLNPKRLRLTVTKDQLSQDLAAAKDIAR